MYAKVIVDISHEKLDKTFEYRIPEELEDKVYPGLQVRIPFGKGNRSITGYVLEVVDIPEFEPEKIKPIDGLVKGAVEAEGHLIQLAAWMKRNFGGTMNQALKTVLPVKQKTKPKEKKTVRLLLSEEEAYLTLGLYDRKNYRARIRLMSALIKEKEIPYDIVLHKLNIAPATIKALEENNMIAVEKERVYRNPVNIKNSEGYHLTLNEEQQHAVDGIMAEYEDGLHNTDKSARPALIYGITGSGKTEIYMELIAQAAKMGKQSIMLIPEIALTYQTVMRFYKRFGDRVSILNSRMSPGERYDQFVRAKNGEIDVMIGPRSALFTPFENLGFIIIDEEHESAYRSENVPRYSAVETAIARAKMLKAMVVLGSATPSVEDYYKAKQGIYDLYILKNRATGADLAEVSVVDLREELASGNRSVLSRKLKQKMEDRLKKDQQTMLFLNRRGMAGFLTCRTCGNVIKCPHCDISLSRHNNGKMICHYCGYEEPMAKACPKCGSTSIGEFKAGTQKMEEIVKKTFPDARVLRMDFDTTRDKDGHEQILSAFASHEADILIGTQMIVKGHDFPNVTLVGVLAADLSLYVADYRASERTFQLLTQAAGRAGRGRDRGEVVIQTYNPEHYAIKTSAAQAYEDFYEEEILYRTLLSYPPISNMLTIYMSSPNESLLENAADLIAAKLEEKLKESEKIQGETTLPRAENPDNVKVIGPATPSVAKINDQYKKVVYLKTAKYDKLVGLKDFLEDYIMENKAFSRVGVQFEFNK